MSADAADAAADADAAAERRLNHSIPRTYFVRGIQLKQHTINIKNYTAHPHDMVHIPAKFRENTSMRF